MHDVGTKALDELVDCHVQTTLPSRSAEKIELDPIIDADQLVGHHPDQTEGTAVIKLFEEVDADRVEPLGDVSRFAESALTGQNLKVCCLELYAHAEGNVALLPEAPADCIG